MPVEQATLESLDRGYSGTARTIEKMHELVAQGKTDPSIQRIASWIRLQVPGDYWGNSKQVADAIFRWVKEHGVFMRDPFQLEKISHPLVTTIPIIKAKQAGQYSGPGIFVGDCDDYSIWVATLGGILGFQYAFETAKVDESRPDEFSHVWAALLVNGRWYALDASTPSATPGWRPPVPQDRIKDWPEKHIEEVRMNGLGRYGMGEEGVSEEGWSAERYVPQASPDAMEPLVPMLPTPAFADEEKTDEALYRAPAPRPFQRPALMETEAQVPKYQNWGADPVKQISVSTPYPYDWPWAKQVEVVYPGVVALNGYRDAFRRRVRRGMSGMGIVSAGEPKDNYNYAGVTQVAPTGTQAAAVQDNLTSQIFNSIDNVAKLFTTVKTSEVEAEKAKYAAVVAGAITANGGTPKPASSPYTLPILIGGGAAVAGVIAFLLTRK